MEEARVNQSRRRRAPVNPSIAVAYVRCSTDRQDLSPEAQRAAIDAFARVAEIEVVAVHEDLGVSGGTALEERPGLLAAMESLRVHGAGVLVVAKRDRLARDVLTAALVERLCERAGARVQSADGTGNGHGPEAQLLRGIVDLFAQYERAIIRSRTKAALAVKRARGERVGTVPYGRRVGADGRLEDHPEEAAAVARARELRAGGASLRKIAVTLVTEGHRPRGSGAWVIQTLRRMVAGA
jgi:DNA invertase Pin-like site-specific DNA recombinase